MQPPPCLLLGNSVRLTQIIISSHLSLITLFYFHIFSPSFGSRASCQHVIQRGMDVSNHHILFRAVAFSETRLIIAASSKKIQSSKVLIPHVISFSRELSVDQGSSVWECFCLAEDKDCFFPPCIQQALVFLAIISSVCLYGCLSPRVMSVCGQECLYSKFWVCVRFQKHKEQLTCCRTS